MRYPAKSSGEKIVKDIKRATREQYSLEEKIRIFLNGPRGEDSSAELCRREGIFQAVSHNVSLDKCLLTSGDISRPGRNGAFRNKPE